ncbi:phage protein [Xanthobacter agilis]|uniref:DUF3277 family protein n=1 Tax=Xanthobacter agilis TaxID=47492 RepID=A0ABU0LJU2_XANAG|nr:phage protein [Xanthobacter agilis]MDQ0507410.1 hypothetical protein [Xanthobacter agilis]
MSVYSFSSATGSIDGPGGSFSFGYGSDNDEGGITVTFIEDKNTMTIGADGGGMHSLHAGRAGTITVRLLKTSAVNKLFTDLYRYQTSSPANHGQNTISIRDTVRGDVVTAQGGAFKKMPDNAWAKNGNTLEWSFDCITIDQKLG